MGASGTTQPCSRLTCKMWTALVLVCLSSLSLSESRVASQDPRSLVLNKTQDTLVKKRISGETTKSVFNQTSEKMTMTTPSPVTLAKKTVVGHPGSPAVTAGRTHRTDVGPSATAAGPPDHAASGVPVPPAPTLAPPTPSSTAALSTPGTQAPSGSTLPRAAPLATLTTSAQAAAATTANASSPTGMQSPAKHTPGHSTASTAPPTSAQALNASTQGSTIQASTAGPVADTASRPIPPLVNATPEAIPPSVASVSTTVVTTTKAQAEGPASTIVPAPLPDTSPTPGVGATSPTTQPISAPSSQGPTGPGTSQTPEQVQPEATGGTASPGPAPGSSGDSKMSVTDSCQLSTQGQHLLATTRPPALSSENKSSLLAVLLLGVTLFFTVLVLFALQAYESYKKKDYTQVDYLINGMYADSEM